MSFWPLPKNLLEHFVAGSRCGLSVELGAGDGAFRSRLTALGIDVLALDLQAGPLRALPIPCVCANVIALPFPADSVGLMTAANLWRHLSPADRAVAFREASRVLCHQGCIVLLEDAPKARDRSEDNYRRCLDLLARADSTRGASISLASQLAVADDAGLELRGHGEFDNSTELHDPQLPLRWLHRHPMAEDWRHELEELSDAVRRDGMKVGRAQFAAWGTMTS
jgi:SAM-dependent methyltransferase